MPYFKHYKLWAVAFALQMLATIGHLFFKNCPLLLTLSNVFFVAALAAAITSFVRLHKKFLAFKKEADFWEGECARYSREADRAKANLDLNMQRFSEDRLDESFARFHFVLNEWCLWQQGVSLEKYMEKYRHAKRPTTK
jgi:hypothetical protein